MKSTHQTLLALSVSCVLAASLAGCGVQITGVALDLPDLFSAHPRGRQRSGH